MAVRVSQKKNTYSSKLLGLTFARLRARLSGMQELPAAIRHRLFFGPYGTPRFRYGRLVTCARRGPLRIIGLSAGRIPWPIGQPPAGSRDSNRSLVLYGALARAVRRESATAVCYWWGVTAQTVSAWRKVLGVVCPNDGERRLRQAIAAMPWFRERFQARGWAKNGDPARRAKISAAKRGKPRPPELMAALHMGNVGRKHTAEARRKMSEAHKRRGTRPPGRTASV